MMLVAFPLEEGCQVCRCEQLSGDGLWRWSIGTGYTAGPKRKQKAEVCGGRTGSPSPRGFPSCLPRGGPAAEATVLMLEQGFCPSTVARLPPAGGT
jgi:hypothetical protein